MREVRERGRERKRERERKKVRDRESEKERERERRDKERTDAREVIGRGDLRVMLCNQTRLMPPY